MLKAKDTKKHGGVELSGTGEDLEELYDSLYLMLSNMDEKSENGEILENSVNIRVFALCYDLRHAHPALSFMDNILLFKPEAEKGPGDGEGDFEEPPDSGTSLEPGKGCFRVTWPEAVFICLALNDYLLNEYSRRYSKQFKNLDWTPAFTAVRKFQIVVIDCLCTLLSPVQARSARKIFMDPYTSYRGYCTHYLDQLNNSFLAKDQAQRLKFLSLLPKRLSTRPVDYYGLEARVNGEAKARGCSPWDLRLDLEEPKEIVW